jgi:hypothetical protein
MGAARPPSGSGAGLGPFASNFVPMVLALVRLQLVRPLRLTRVVRARGVCVCADVLPHDMHRTL